MLGLVICVIEAHDGNDEPDKGVHDEHVSNEGSHLGIEEEIPKCCEGHVFSFVKTVPYCGFEPHM